MFVRDEIISIISNKIPSILESFNFSFMMLFGSVSEDKARWWSDIDIVISLPEYDNMQVKDLHKYKIKLAVLLDKILNTDKVQISIWESLPPHVKFSALKTGILIFTNNKKEFQEIKEKTLIEYWDHIIWYKRVLNASFEESMA